MNFLQLVQFLEHHLGHHQIPIKADARDLQDLFETAPLHHELLPRIAQAIYKANRCRTLQDAVCGESTFAAIAPIRLEVLRAANTDIDLYRLIEELCTAVAAAFSSSEPPAQPKPARDRAVVPFPRLRRVRSLA